MRAVIVALILLATDNPQVSVSPRVMMAGSAVRVTCRVPRHSANRSVTWGFTDWTTSTRQLDGESSMITWTLELKRVPCDPGEAFCVVARVGARQPERASSHVEVAGCDTQNPK
jgi:hypothetical protein